MKKNKIHKPAYGLPQEQPTWNVSGYGVPGNNPDKRRPAKPDDLPQEVKEWLDQITNHSGKNRGQ